MTNKKVIIIIVGFLLAILILIGFISPLFGKRLSRQQIIWRTRIALLDNYWSQLERYKKEYPDILFSMNNFKKYLNGKINYQNNEIWEKEFHETYGENVTPLDVFEVISFTKRGELQWGIVEIDPNHKHSNCLFITTKATLLLIKEIGIPTDNTILNSPIK
ncbi:MAG: hypothetical protein BWY31_03771 [Lentisphaerae bacterium ADurb.Bin242]|nr:MAG: hypothetical protein BWY31_03771 [Lentisphaerae bacterium ADurb.Bin242]